MATVNLPTVDSFTKMLQAVVRDSLDAAIEEVAQEIEAKVMAKVRGEADKMALEIMSHYVVERMDGEIVVRVIKAN